MDENNLNGISVAIVDDEPLIRKAVMWELNSRNEQVLCRVSDDGRTTMRPVQITETYGSGAELFASLASSKATLPDYLLLDIELRGEPTGGLSIAERMSKQYPGRSKIIMFSGRFDNPLPSDPQRGNRLREVGNVIFEALRCGASAFVSKNAVGGFSIDNIIQAIASLERGEQYYFNYPVMLTLKEAAEAYFDTLSTSQAIGQFTDEEKLILLHEAEGCTAQEIAFRLTDYVETDKSIQDKQKEISRKMNIVNKSGARIAKAITWGLIDLRAVHYLKR